MRLLRYLIGRSLQLRGRVPVFFSLPTAPGAEVRVYTNRDIEGSFSFGRRSAIWNNSGDCGYLYDPNGTEVSKYCY
jgi:hypothetical protein